VGPFSHMYSIVISDEMMGKFTSAIRYRIAFQRLNRGGYEEYQTGMDFWIIAMLAHIIYGI
jgi:hypothetical protein